MYELTPRMIQRLKRDLTTYHSLFTGDRCKGWELEELIVNSIKSDSSEHHHVLWQEAGHDDKADIEVQISGDSHLLQIKSGQVIKDRLVLSGHRLGRFKADFDRITEYLNSTGSQIIAVPYKQINDDNGRTHQYQVVYVDLAVMRGLRADAWEKIGAQYRQTNAHGVAFSLCPSMSWQIWWRIPVAKITITKAMQIG